MTLEKILAPNSLWRSYWWPKYRPPGLVSQRAMFRTSVFGRCVVYTYGYTYDYTYGRFAGKNIGYTFYYYSTFGNGEVWRDLDALEASCVFYALWARRAWYIRVWHWLRRTFWIFGPYKHALTSR